MTWDYDKTWRIHVTPPASGFPTGKYTIFEDSRGGPATLVINSDPVERLMRGTVEECKGLAAEAERDAPLELEFEPDLGAVGQLEPETAALVELALRVGASGKRLQALASRGVPQEMYDLELSILREYSEKLGESL